MPGENQYDARENTALPSLDSETKRLELEKLTHEASLARYQASPRGLRNERFKAFAGLAAVVTAIAAVAGILATQRQSLKTADDARTQRIEERFERNVSALADQNPSTRLFAVVALRSFISASDDARARRALDALANALALESSPYVQGSILTALSPEGSIESPARRVTALGSLVVSSQSLLVEFRQLQRRFRSGELQYDEAVIRNVNQRGAAIQRAMVSLMVSGARVANMASIYCRGCDLRRLNLAGIVFDDSSLSGTDFSGAILDRASFRNADLDATEFRGARLRNAILTQRLDRNPSDPFWHDYAFMRLVPRSRVSQPPVPNTHHFQTGVIIPDFTCADLSGADFAGHPLVYVIPDDSEFEIFAGASFRGANLQNTNFLSVRLLIFARTRPDLDPRDLSLPVYPTEPFNNNVRLDSRFSLFEGPIDNAGQYVGADGFLRTKALLRDLYHASNWRNARMPPALQALLAAANVIDQRAPDCAQVLKQSTSYTGH